MGCRLPLHDWHPLPLRGQAMSWAGLWWVCVLAHEHVSDVSELSSSCLAYEI